MAFHCPWRYSYNPCNFVDANVLHVEQRDAGSFHFFKHFEWLVDIHFFFFILLFGAVDGVYFSCIQVGCLFPAANIIIKNIISNTIQPRRETWQVPERGNVRIRFDKCILRKVVTQFAVAASQVQEESPDGRLILLHQLVKGPGVLEHHDLCD